MARRGGGIYQRGRIGRLRADRLSVGLAALLLGGCATALPADLLRPRAVTTEIPTLAWPTVALTIIDDRRNATVAHEPLVSAIESTIRRATFVSSAAESPDLRLTVTVVRHEAGFAGGGSPWWTGATELRAVLTTTGGDVINSWRVVDVSQEWNVFGYSSGTAAAQDSLRDGLRTLLRRMAAEVQFGQVLPSGAVILRPSNIGPRETSEPPAPPDPAASALFCRQRVKGLQPRATWLAEYRRCMAGY